MMKTSVKVTTKDRTVVLAKVLKDLSRMDVLVGIPEEKGPRRGSGQISNAQLLFIHSNGSPLRGIPKRAVIEPAIEAEDHKEAIAEQFALAAQYALNGDKAGALRHLKLAGMTGQNAARDWFEDTRNGWPPLSPITIARKGSDAPLIDTGQMRKAITYVVRDGE